MSNDTVVSLAVPAQVSDPLTELLRSGARRLIEAAVSAEFEEYLSGFVQEQLPDGAPAGGSQRPPSGTQDSHRRGRGGRAGAQGTQSLGFARAVPLFGGASLRSALRKPRCGDSVAVPARGVHRSDASGGRRAGGRGGRPWAVGERGQSGSSAAGTRSTASGAVGARTTSGSTCGRTASTAAFAASTSGCACWW